ncbi:MAG: hypothetical protein ABIZ50_06540, partial [Solirubrobacterales bacterium]
DGVAPSERASESPYVPGDFVGLPELSETGPYLMAFLDGPEAALEGTRVTGASLTGPNGPVPIAYIGTDDPNLGQFISLPMTFIIPRQPLAEGTAYAATATFEHPTSATNPTLKSEAVKFCFSTAGATPQHAAPCGDKAKEQGGDPAQHRLYLKSAHRKSPKFSLRPDEPLVGQRARVTVTHYSRSCERKSCPAERSRRSHLSRTLKARQSIAVRASRGDVRIKVKVEVAQFAVDGIEYPATSATATWRPPGPA